MTDGSQVNVTVDNGGNGFSNKEILVRLEAKVDKVLDDHEKRLRLLERFRNSVPGISVLAVVVSGAAVVVSVIH